MPRDLDIDLTLLLRRLDPKPPHNPDDSWAEVELFRLQHGILPNDERAAGLKLDRAVGLEKLADLVDRACRSRDMSILPPPLSVVDLLRYFARRERAR